MKRKIALLLVFVLMLFSVIAFASEYTDKDTVKKVQIALNASGYDCGTPDGISGNKTKNAISRYQADNSLAVTGAIDDDLLTALDILNADDAENSGIAPDISALEIPENIEGDFDKPALINPEERYDVFFDKTDGSENLVYSMIDFMNDEATDIEEHGALYITENQMLDENGVPTLKLKMSMQNTPYGKAIVSKYKFLWMETNTYAINSSFFVHEGDTVETQEGYSQEDFDFYCESYHFPYGSLEVLNGIRQDENGYAYFFIESTDGMSFEFVVGEGMRIQQLRVYMENESGELKLWSYVDYDVGSAWEIPEIVLDAMEREFGSSDN